MSERRHWAAAVVLAVALTGCISAAQAAPTCDDNGRDILVLMAQSVPSADYVPCIDALPAGWTVTDLEIKNGRSRLHLTNNAMAVPSVVTLAFSDRCDLDDAVQVPSDEENVRRFEDVTDVTNGYRGTSYYTFRGGCVSLAFDVRGDGWSAVANDASTTMTFTSRTELQRYVRTRSRGVIQHL